MIVRVWVKGVSRKKNGTHVLQTNMGEFRALPGVDVATDVTPYDPIPIDAEIDVDNGYVQKMLVLN